MCDCETAKVIALGAGSKVRGWAGAGVRVDDEDGETMTHGNGQGASGAGVVIGGYLVVRSILQTSPVPLPAGPSFRKTHNSGQHAGSPPNQLVRSIRRVEYLIQKIR